MAGCVFFFLFFFGRKSVRELPAPVGKREARQLPGKVTGHKILKRLVREYVGGGKWPAAGPSRVARAGIPRVRVYRRATV